GDGMLAGRIQGGIGPGSVCRDGAVVDDAPAARGVLLHEAKRLLRAEERAGEVDVDDATPLLDGQVLQGNGRSAGAGVVEQQIESAEGFLRLLEQPAHGGWVADVGGNGQGTRASRS